MKTIVAFAFSLLILVNGMHGRITPRGEQFCKSGTTFKSDCNTCVCSQDGTSAKCTKLICQVVIPFAYLDSDGSVKLPHETIPLLREKRDQICEPAFVRTWDCNTCRCNPDGTAEICTETKCSNRSSQEPNIAYRCKPNSQFRDDCNTCTCFPNGLNALCTRMLCGHSTNPILRTK